MCMGLRNWDKDELHSISTVLDRIHIQNVHFIFEDTALILGLSRRKLEKKYAPALDNYVEL